ncbi:MAG: ankyrin repeat domain-containing protein [bacterium]
MKFKITFIIVALSLAFFQVEELKADELNNQLLFAVQAMNLGKASAAIKNGADVNGIDDDGWPLFISAVNSDSESMISLFLNNRVKVDIAGPDGKTALMHALSSKNTKIANRLIGYRASLNAKDNNGKTILMYAAEAGIEAIVNRVMKAKVDIYAKDNRGWSALNYAMAGKNKKIIKNLGQHETKPTDFLIAVENGDTVKARTLLRQGMSPDYKNENGEPMILVAIKNNNRMMLKLLLEFNADVNFKNSKGHTIFMLCLANGKLELAKELLKYGAVADFNYKYSEGKTAMMVAILSKDRRFMTSIAKFRQNFNIRDDYGNTALMYAAGMGLSDLVKLFLEKGADKSIKRKDGRTAADIARARGYTYIAKMLE